VRDSGRRLDQHLSIWTKRSVDEFIAHIRDAEYVRGHRLCIDRRGNIGYICNGPVAVRSDAFDWGTPVNGWIADTEWEDRLWRPGATEYALPAFTNSDCGFIQSANDPPWVTTIPAMTGSDYPKYVFPEGWRALGPRGARQREVLHGTASIARSAALALLLDVFVPRAYHGVRALTRRFDAEREQLPPLSRGAAHIDALLRAWDGRADRDSTAMTAAFYMNRALPHGFPEPVVRATDDPTVDPEIREPLEFALTGRAYAQALEEVVEQLEATYGRLDHPWGEMHAIVRPRGDLGVPGGCNTLRALFGTWRGWWDVDDVVDADGVERCNFGTRTLRFTELSTDGVTVESVTVTGQLPASEHPESPHLLDQSELYARLELKRFPLARSEVEARRESRGP
jgi:acyl-homoserine-lactone acylase